MENAVKHFHTQDCKPVATPTEMQQYLVKITDNINMKDYQAVIGALGTQ